MGLELGLSWRPYSSADLIYTHLYNLNNQDADHDCLTSRGTPWFAGCLHSSAQGASLVAPDATLLRWIDFASMTGCFEWRWVSPLSSLSVITIGSPLLSWMTMEILRMDSHKEKSPASPQTTTGWERSSFQSVSCQSHVSWKCRWWKVGCGVGWEFSRWAFGRGGRIDWPIIWLYNRSDFSIWHPWTVAIWLLPLNFLAAFFFSSSLLFHPHLRLRGSRYRLLSSYLPLYQNRRLCRSPLRHLFRLLGGARLIASFPRHAFVPRIFLSWNLRAPTGPLCCFRGLWRALPSSCLLSNFCCSMPSFSALGLPRVSSLFLMSHSIYTNTIKLSNLKSQSRTFGRKNSLVLITLPMTKQSNRQYKLHLLTLSHQLWTKFKISKT